MSKNVFEIEEVTAQQVIIKVNAKDALTVAKHPYVSSDLNYITVTRGEKHTLTTIKEDGTHGVSFNWGVGGHTLISDGLKRLQKEVESFIESNFICLDAATTEPARTAKTYLNTNYGKWQLTLGFSQGQTQCFWHEKREGLNSFLEAFGFEPDGTEGIAQTGITVWEHKKTNDARENEEKPSVLKRIRASVSQRENHSPHKQKQKQTAVDLE